MRKPLLYLFLFFAGWANAQQAPIFSQFFFQRNIVNPAAAGSFEHPTMTAFHRQQWAGLEGAPSTQALSFGARAFGDRVGLGATLMNDRIGFFNTTFVNLAYAYRISFNASTVSIGMHSSYLHQQADWGEAKTIGFGNDPNANGEDLVPIFNVGVGGYFESERFFAGISVPQLLEKGITQQVDGLANDGSGWVRHIFAHVGTIVEMYPAVLVRPALAARLTAGSPPGFDAHLSFGLLEKSKLWLGGTWRWSQSEVAPIGDAFVFTGQYRIADKLTLGFAYDFSFNEIQTQTSGTYELIGIIFTSSNRSEIVDYISEN